MTFLLVCQTSFFAKFYIMKIHKIDHSAVNYQLIPALNRFILLSCKNKKTLLILLPWRFKKAGRVWCGGTRETREPRATIGWVLPVRDILSNLHAFQDLNGVCSFNLHLTLNDLEWFRNRLILNYYLESIILTYKNDYFQ